MATPGEAEALMKAAHETGNLNDIVKAYAAMELRGTSHLPLLVTLRAYDRPATIRIRDLGPKIRST